MRGLVLAVLLLGACSAPASGPPATAAAQGISQIGSMLSAKSSHTATRLADGTVLIAGGSSAARTRGTLEVAT